MHGILIRAVLLCALACFQMGSYFGSSLCAVDLNADGLSDLLVGAPMFSEVRDEGQVSVYISRGNVSSLVDIIINNVCTDESRNSIELALKNLHADVACRII